MPSGPEAIEPESAWIGVEELSVQFANAFAAVVGPHAVFINIGSSVPPGIETEEDLAQLRFIPVKPIARLALAPQGLDGLIETLENTRRIYKELQKALGEGPQP